MKAITPFILVVCLWTAGQNNNPANAQKKAKPKFTISKETTYVTEPVDKDGYIDYAAALNKIMSQGVTPDNNANVLLWQAIGPHSDGSTMPPEFYKWLGIKAPPPKGDYFVSQFRYLIEQGQIDPIKDEEKLTIEYELSRRWPWRTGKYPHIAHWLRAQEKPLAVVIQASQRTKYFAPIVVPKLKYGPKGISYHPTTDLVKSWEATEALVARAMWHLGEGRAREAWQDLLAAHRLGRLMTHVSSHNEARVGLDIDNMASEAELAYLAKAKLDGKQIKTCLADLQKLPPVAEMAEMANLGERFMCLEYIMLMDRYGPNFFYQSLAFGVDMKNRPFPLTGRVDWDLALLSINDWYNKLYLAMKVNDHAGRTKKLDEFNEEQKILAARTLPLNCLQKFFMTADERVKRYGDELIRLMVPSGHQAHYAWDRTEQMQNNLHLAFALAAYKSEQGQYPKTLAALAPKYLAKIPQDIYSGKALIYRPSAKGYLLYSVGKNGEDDQGRWHDDDPPGDDPRVKMPLPEPKRKR